MAIGELNQAATQHVNPGQLFPCLSKREAVMSSRIEGTHTTLQEAFVGSGIEEEDPDRHEVLNYELALQLGIQAMGKGRSLGFPLIKELHVRLLSGVRGRNKKPGAYREAQVLLGSGHAIESARFVPPPPTAILGCLEELQAWMSRPIEDMHQLVRIALTHYQFETIHPFEDGNGRIGRLLIALQFLSEGLVKVPLLFVSPYLEARREDYYQALFRVSSEGAFNPWIEFFLAGVKTSAKETTTKISAIESLLREYASKVAAAKRSHQPLRLVDYLRATPFLTIPDATEVLEVSSTVARNTVKALVDLEILEPTGFQRMSSRKGVNPDYYYCPRLWEIVSS